MTLEQGTQWNIILEQGTQWNIIPYSGKCWRGKLWRIGQFATNSPKFYPPIDCNI